eukprot:3448191-Rhodomonas_salina.2
MADVVSAGMEAMGARTDLEPMEDKDRWPATKTPGKGLTQARTCCAFVFCTDTDPIVCSRSIRSRVLKGHVLPRVLASNLNTANLHLYTQLSVSFLDLKMMKAHTKKLAKQSLGRRLHMNSDFRLACLLASKWCQYGLFVLAAVKIALVAHRVIALYRPVKHTSFRLTELDPTGSVSRFGAMTELGGFLQRVTPRRVQHTNLSLIATYDDAVHLQGAHLLLAPNASSHQTARSAAPSIPPATQHCCCESEHAREDGGVVLYQRDRWGVVGSGGKWWERWWVRVGIWW